MPAHVACVMDGNGRWASQRGLPRTEGHAAGEEALLDVVNGALDIGVRWLTMFAFSTENWRRPPDEVRYLMGFNESLLMRRRDELHEKGVRIRFAGRRDWRVPRRVLRRMDESIELTEDNRPHDPDHGLQLRRPGRDRRRRAGPGGRGRRRPTRSTSGPSARHLYYPDMPDPDLVIRTSGEYRISNFLLWELAYSELVFTDVLWPDFRRAAPLRGGRRVPAAQPPLRRVSTGDRHAEAWLIGAGALSPASLCWLAVIGLAARLPTVLVTAVALVAADRRGQLARRASVRRPRLVDRPAGSDHPAAQHSGRDGVDGGDRGPRPGARTVSLYRDQGVVLRTYRLGEADRIVVLMTEHHGKVRAVAKGVRRTASKFGARLEPLSHVALLFWQGRGELDIVNQAEVIDHFRAVREDLDRMAQGLSLLEVADQLAQERHADPRPLRDAGGGAAGAGRPRARPDLVAPAFFLKALALEGAGPVLDVLRLVRRAATARSSWWPSTWSRAASCAGAAAGAGRSAPRPWTCCAGSSAAAWRRCWPSRRRRCRRGGGAGHRGHGGPPRPPAAQRALRRRLLTPARRRPR